MLSASRWGSSIRAAETSTTAISASSSQSSPVRPVPTCGARLPTSMHHERVASTSVPKPTVRRAVSSAHWVSALRVPSASSGAAALCPPASEAGSGALVSDVGVGDVVVMAGPPRGGYVAVRPTAPALTNADRTCRAEHAARQGQRASVRGPATRMGGPLLTSRIRRGWGLAARPPRGRILVGRERSPAATVTILESELTHVNPLTTRVFDLPPRLAAKADPALIAADEQHFARIGETLEQSIVDLTRRRDAERRQP